MGKNGFTIVELIVTMAIIGILLSIGTLMFSQMSKKGSMEAQVRMLHADIMEVRAQSLYQRSGRSMVFAAGKFAAYPSHDVTVTPVLVRDYRFPMSASGQVDFDERGIVTSGDKYVCISEENNAVIDSIIITPTQIRFGKRKAGEECSNGHIIFK